MAMSQNEMEGGPNFFSNLGLRRISRDVSGPCTFSSDIVIPLDNGSDSLPGIAVFDSRLHADNSSRCVYEYFSAASYLRRQGKRQLQNRASLQVLIHNEIEAARRDVPGLACLLCRHLLRSHANDNRQR